MRKSTVSLAVATVGVLGLLVVYALGETAKYIVQLEFFAGTALMGGLTYVIARRNQLRLDFSPRRC